jgi:hypothetical protein
MYSCAGQAREYLARHPAEKRLPMRTTVHKTPRFLHSCSPLLFLNGEVNDDRLNPCDSRRSLVLTVSTQPLIHMTAIESSLFPFPRLNARNIFFFFASRKHTAGMKRMRTFIRPNGRNCLRRRCEPGKACPRRTFEAAMTLRARSDRRAISRWHRE